MVKRNGHSSFETVIVMFLVAIGIIVVVPMVTGYIQDARVTKATTEIREEEKVISETIVSIYSSKFVNEKGDKLTGEYIVKQIKRNSNNGLKIYIYGEENPLYTENTADMVIYLTMTNDDGTVCNPVTETDISGTELMSITAYRIVGSYGVYIYDGQLYK